MTGVTRVARWIGTLAAEPLRSELHGDGLVTLSAVCADARRQGRAAMVRAALGELFSMLAGAVRSRLGRAPRVTGGQRPTRTPPGRSGGFDRFLQDVRGAWRSLAAAPGHAALAIATLALGIGVNTAVFSVLDAVLIRPVPYPAAERLATLWRYRGESGTRYRGGFAPEVVAEWRRQTDLVDLVEGAEPRTFIYTTPEGAHTVSGSLVTPGLMPMLGATPVAGRLFTEGDGRAGTERTVVLSEWFWRAELGAASDVIEHDIVLDGVPYRVVGVASRAFRYPDQQQSFWLPYDVTAPPPGTTASLTPIVRLAAGLTAESAIEPVEARSLAVRTAVGRPDDDAASPMQIGRLFDDKSETSLLVLGVAVFLLLLIVCANVANLTLAKALTRSRDRAVRSALGASRWRLVRVAFLEHAWLGLAGAVGALWVAGAALDITVAVLPETMTVSSQNAIDLDLRSLGFLACTAVLAVLLVGVPPAWFSSRASVLDALRRETRATSGSTATRRARSALVVAEVALSIVLLVGAALMTRTVVELQAIDVGMDTDGLLSMELALPAPNYAGEPGSTLRNTMLDDVLERLRRDPDVIAASAGPVPPQTRMVQVGPIDVAGGGRTEEDEFLLVFDVWPGYFDAAGIEILEGRALREDDAPGAAVVSDLFARRHLGGSAAVGARYRVGESDWRTVVGVVRTIRSRGQAGEPDRLQVYYAPDDVGNVFRAIRPTSEIADYRTLVVRASAPDAVAARLASIVHAVDPLVVTSPARAVERLFADDIARPRIVFVMMVTFAGFGLLLAAAGLYGVLSHLVTQRMREVGIRLALGATPRDIGRGVLRSGLLLTGLGIAIGLMAALALAAQMRSLLYEVVPFDPVAIAVVTGVLLATATLAMWRPARRAMRADPLTLLRDE